MTQFGWELKPKSPSITPGGFATCYARDEAFYYLVIEYLRYYQLPTWAKSIRGKDGQTETPHSNSREDWLKIKQLSINNQIYIASRDFYLWFHAYVLLGKGWGMSYWG